MTAGHKFEQKFSALQPREQRLIFWGSLALFIWLAIILLLQPTWQNWQQAKVDYSDLQDQAVSLTKQAEVLHYQATADISEEYQQQIDQLIGQQRQLKQQIQQKAQHFISAEQMVSLLQNMLENSATVQLQLLTTSQPQPLRLDGQPETDNALLYQHKITLQLSGSFSSLLQALQSIEQLPWLVDWQQLEYKVLEHPAAVMTLQLVTVSEHEDIIRL